MSCFTANDMVRQIRHEEKFIRKCQDKRDELRRLKHNDNEHNN